MAPVKIENWTKIEELIQMSLGTNKGSWWADPSFGSELWILQRNKVDGSTAGKVRSTILESTRWIVGDGLAKDITCTAERTGKNKIAYVITVTRPDGDTITIKDAWYAE